MSVSDLALFAFLCGGSGGAIAWALICIFRANEETPLRAIACPGCGMIARAGRGTLLPGYCPRCIESRLNADAAATLRRISPSTLNDL